MIQVDQLLVDAAGAIIGWVTNGVVTQGAPPTGAYYDASTPRVPGGAKAGGGGVSDANSTNAVPGMSMPGAGGVGSNAPSVGGSGGRLPDDPRTFDPYHALDGGGPPIPPGGKPGGHYATANGPNYAKGDYINPDGSVAYQSNAVDAGPMTDDQMRANGLGGYAPKSTYGSGAGQYAPLSGADPTGKVTDPRLGGNFTGEAYDPWSYGGNGGHYQDGQYIAGSNGFDERSGEYNKDAAQRYADYNNIAGSAAYDASTADTKNALGLQKSAAEGNQPSQAELLGKIQLDEQLRREQSLAGSARGGSLNQFAAVEQASRNGMQERQQGLAAIAAMRANEMATARGQYGQTATNLSAQQLQAELANRQRQLAAMGLADAAQLDRMKQADAIQQLGMSSAQAKAQLVTGQATQTSIAANQVQASKDIAAQQSSDSLRNTIIGGTVAGGAAVGTTLLGAYLKTPGTGPSAPQTSTGGGSNYSDTPTANPTPTTSNTYTQNDDGSVTSGDGNDENSDMRAKEDIQPLSHGSRWYDDMRPSTAEGLNRYGENRYDDRETQSKQHVAPPAANDQLAAQVASLREQIASLPQSNGSATDAGLARYGDAPMRVTTSTQGQRSGGGGPWQRSTSDYESQHDRLARQAADMQSSLAASQAMTPMGSATDGALNRWTGDGEILSDDRTKLRDAYNLGRAHQDEAFRGGSPEFAFEASPDLVDRDIDPKKIARRHAIDKGLAKGRAVVVSDEEAEQQLHDPRSAPVVPTTYYREAPAGIASTVTAPIASPPMAPKEYDPNMKRKRMDPEEEILSDKRTKNTDREDEPMAKANRAMKPSSYRYKDEFTPKDQAPGERNVGPMAQSMAADPVASTAVIHKPNGLLALNRNKLAKLTAGGVAYLQERVDDLERKIASMKKAKA